MRYSQAAQVADADPADAREEHVRLLVATVAAAAQQSLDAGMAPSRASRDAAAKVRERAVLLVECRVSNVEYGLS